MFFMAPVNAGYIRYSDLKNGSMNLYDLFVLNEFINYKNDYEAITDELMEAEANAAKHR